MPVVNFNKWAYRLVEDRTDNMGMVPVFDQEAFQLGITFKAKYVGTLEITRPSCRTEIVTAMRKVRYEFKIKGIEKRRVFLTISVDGIKVILRKRRRRLRKEYLLDEEPVVLHEHQIGRIFYVSHDSMDLKIFSYITKDSFDNQFRCSVFKAYRKSKALFVVRTIGQAFEVCHRLQQETAEETKGKTEVTPKVDERVLADEGTDIDAVDEDGNDAEKQPGVTNKDKATPTMVQINELIPPVDPDGKAGPLTVEQLRVLFNQQLRHYMQESEVYKAENQMMKDQLLIERNARIQAQEREQCLLTTNRELLQTIQTLVNRLQSINPGDESVSSLTSQEPIFNTAYPSMFSTPYSKDNMCGQSGLVRGYPGMDRDQLGITGNSVVITPPADTLATFDPLAKGGDTKTAPLATGEILNGVQPPVGLFWKKFDDDDVTCPEKEMDGSSSESSDDENFADNFDESNIIPSEQRNGWKDLTDKIPNGNSVHANSGNMAANTYFSQQNGISRKSGNENNNHFDNPASTDTRTAVQTDF